MRKIITLLIMALLMAGTADVDAKVNKYQTKKKRQTTTATTKTKTRKKARPAAQQILPPQREITEDMLRTDYRNSNWNSWDDYLVNYKKALDGDAEQQYWIGIKWELGAFGEEDQCEALRWFYLAAKQGYGDAEYEVGHAYEDEYDVTGYHLKPNYFEAAKWYARAKAHGNSQADFDLGLLLKYGHITNKEFRIVTEQAGMDSQSARQEALAAEAAVGESNKNDKKYARFYGTWTSARGTTFTISEGPYLDLRGAGKFEGEWRSNGELHVDFGYPDEINLKYSNGYLYDRDGRMYWRLGQ